MTTPSPSPKQAFPSAHRWNIHDFYIFDIGGYVFVHAQLLSGVRLLVTPWTVAHQAPLSVGFSRQEHWSGWPFPPPGDLLEPGIKLTSPALAGGFFTTEPSGLLF